MRTMNPRISTRPVLRGCTWASLPLLAALGLSACDRDAGLDDDITMTDAEVQPDGSFVSVVGTVAESGADSFILDYGAGTITVEMDDYDWYPDGYKILENDPVVVYGYVDDGLFEKRTIEASSVYVSDLGTQFYASGIDEEDFPVAAVIDYDPRVEMRGTVASKSGREFKLDLGAGLMIDVDTSSLLYNPLDDEGFQQIDKGDRVSVTGVIQEELFADRDLMANTLIKLQSSKQGATKTVQGAESGETKGG